MLFSISEELFHFPPCQLQYVKRGGVSICQIKGKGVILVMAVSLYVAVGDECCCHLGSEEQSIRL